MHSTMRLPLFLLAQLVICARRIKVHEVVPNLAHRDASYTRLLVNGTGFVDYGDTRCRFGGELWTRASIHSRQSLSCRTPTWPLERMWHGVSEVPLEVALNGQDYTISLTAFTFYDLQVRLTACLLESSCCPVPLAPHACLEPCAQSTFISSITPHGGPTLGDTRVTIDGAGFIRAAWGAAATLPPSSSSHRKPRTLPRAA